MSSKGYSERSSTPSSNSSSSRPAPKSLVVLRVSLARDETWLFNDLSKNYAGVKRVSRDHDEQGNELSSIRVDFDSEEVVSDILEYDAIYIKDREHFIRPYWPLICHRCRNEGHVARECPENILPESRLAKMMDEQKSNFESLINDFENRWMTRLSKLQTPKPADASQLLPVANDLTNVCQQLNKQNVQMQQQLSTIANRLQTMQIKVTN